MYDVVIIGAGVSGAAAARELSRYPLSVCVVEREEDVCCGTSKANSAIVHAGFDAAPGSLMAKLNVEGNRLMEEYARKLDFPFKRIGSLVTCEDVSGIPGLEKLKAQGEENGVPDLQILSQDEVRRIEPNVADTVVAALYAPTGGIVCPFGLNIALAENAADNGVEFQMNTEVQDICKQPEGFLLKTSKGDIRTKYIVNAAGVYADRFHNMVSEEKMTITARKGEYYLLDKAAGTHVSHTIFALPGKMGKGVLVTPTVHGNLLVGPTAHDIENKEGVNTTADGLAEVATKAEHNVKHIPFRQVITSFAGLRAHAQQHEFIIEEVKDAPGFIDCAGIESPGLTASPAIGRMIAEIFREKLDLQQKKEFKEERKGMLDPEKLSLEERNALIKKQPAYGRIICRCESVSEGEILDAVHRTLGARSLDGVKRRTRAGMGRCQAGFCSPKVMEILSREVPEIEMTNVTKSGGASGIIVGLDKEWI